MYDEDVKVFIRCREIARGQGSPATSDEDIALIRGLLFGWFWQRLPVVDRDAIDVQVAQRQRDRERP